MTASAPGVSASDGLLGSFVFGLAAVALGLVGSLPFALGALMGAVGAGASVALRRWASPPWRSWSVVPAMLAVSVEVIVAPAVPLAELLAGATGVAFLFWMADDPHGSPGAGRRGSTPIAVVAVAVGFSMAIVLVLPRLPSEVGIAGGLLALAMVLVAILLARTRFHTERTLPSDGSQLEPSLEDEETIAPSED